MADPVEEALGGGSPGGAAPKQDAPLDDYDGRYLVNVDTGVGGVLGKDKYGRYTLTDPGGQIVAVAQPGLTFLDPANRALLAVAAQGGYDPGGPGTYMGPMTARISTASETDLKRFGLTSTGGGGGGGGGGSSRTVVGAQAPDPSAAAQLLLKYYEEQVAQGTMQRDAALQQFNADLGAYNANLQRSQQINQDIRERQIAESNRQLGLAQEAGSRAATVARDIVPRLTPGNAASYNVPLLGNIPSVNLNVPQMFSQGLPELAQLPGIPTTPQEATPAPIVSPTLPAINIPQLPNIQPYVNQTAAGFGGFVY